jgi:HEAT repeat protein
MSLGHIKNDAVEAVSAIVPFLNNPNDHLKQSAIFALSVIRVPSEVKATLIGLLKSPSQGIRSSSADALSCIKPPVLEAVPALLEVLKDEDHNTRYVAADALLKISPKNRQVVLEIRKLLKDSDPITRGQVAICLSRCGVLTLNDFPMLMKMLDQADNRERLHIPTQSDRWF